MTKEQLAERAKQLIQSRVQLGEDRVRALIKNCANNVPRDRYVHPRLMRFSADENTQKLLIQYARGHGDSMWSTVEEARIHNNALGQISDVAGINRQYVSKLNVMEMWRLRLLAHNLNELFKNQRFLNRVKDEAEFLHRLVGTEIRAFLTQSYNRHLISQPLLVAFLEACQEVQARPTHALVTDTRVGLQCYLPQAFEPIPGEFIAVGVWWGNSDFGDGKLKVSHTVMRVNSGTSAIMEDSWSRVHLGSVVRDADIRLSDEVAKKEIDTVATAIKDAVKSILNPGSIQRLLDAIAQANAEEIPWMKLQGQLRKILSKDQVDKIGTMLETKIQDLPQPGMDSKGNLLASRWWTSSAIAYLADLESEEDKKADLKQLAGVYLEDK